MAEQVGAIQAIISADIEGFRKSIKTASKSLEDFGKRADKIGREMSLKLTTPILGLGTAAVMSAGKFEKLRTSLNVLTGSAEEGSKAFERLVKFSAGTPFQLDELVKANNTLLGFGMSSDSAYKALKNIGDIAAVSGGDLQGISVAFGQVAASGRLMGQDLLQLINNGVPIIDMLASSMGVATSEVKGLVSEGAVTFPVLIKAFEDATSAGGQFAGGMELQSKTIFGLFSTLRDNMNIALAEIGNSISENLNFAQVVGDLTAYVQRLTASFKQLTPEAQKKLILIAGIAAAIGPMLVVVGQLSIALGGLASAFAFLTGPIGLVVVAIAGVTAAFVYLVDNWEAVKERLGDMGWWRNALIDMVQFIIDFNPFSVLIEAYNKLANLMGGNPITNPFTEMSEGLEGLKVETKEYEHEFGTFAEAVKNGAMSAAEALGLLQKKTGELSTPDTTVDGTTTTPAGGGGGAGQPVTSIPSIADEVINQMDEIERAMETLPTVVETIQESVKIGAESAIGAIGSIIGAMRGLAGDSKALALFEIAANTARGIASAVAAGAGIPFPGNLAAIATGITSVLGGIAQAKSALSSAPAFAQGGMVTGPTLAMVGDNASGKEAIIPFEKMGAFMNMMGGSNVNVNITGEFDGDALRLVLDKSSKDLNNLR
jgi:tape measure domain-containing protein